MKLGYTIFYVPDVELTVSFYERAFGLQRRFVTEEGGYGELETGTTALSFVQEDQATSVLGNEFHTKRPERPPVGAEIAFVTTDVAGAFQKAVEEGAVSLLAPTEKPWGQTVAYVRDCNGFLVELATAMEGTD